jgi:hypothetical protein
MAEDDTKPDGKDDKSVPPKGKDKDKKWIIIGAVGTIVVAYLAYRDRAASSSTATTTPAATTATDTGTSDGTSSGYGSGNGSGGGLSTAIAGLTTSLQAQQAADAANQATTSTSLATLTSAIASVQAEVAGLNPPSAATSPAASTAATPTAASTAKASTGYGQTTIGGKVYDILGIMSGNSPQDYSGYNVSGGAPVYFQAGSQAPQQGVSEAVVGAQVLTPAIYGANISTTPTHQLGPAPAPAVHAT